MEIFFTALITQINHSKKQHTINTNKAENIIFGPKECTDAKMPLLVIKVAIRHRIKGMGVRIMVQSLNWSELLMPTRLCKAAMATSHGRSEAFSTGSHAQ